MDRRDIGTAISATLPAILSLVLEKVVGPPMEGLLAQPWAGVVLLIAGLLAAMAWLRYSRRWFGATAGEYQEALDRIIDRIYILPPAERPPEGISTEGVVMEHAPEGFRNEQYRKLGLPQPKPHKSQYR